MKISYQTFVRDVILKENKDIEVGDTILVGRWKNSPAEVKGFGKDVKNQPVVKTNKGRFNLYRFRIQKLLPKSKSEN